jgi:hypothetical protein
LPGWGILGTLWSGWRELDFLEKFSLGSGISLAIYPVLFLWTNLVGLHLGPLYAWLPPLFGLVLLLWRYPQRILSRVFRNKPASGSSSELGIINPPLAPRFVPDATFEEIASKVAFVILSGAVIFTRFWVIRSLDFPLWGDSYQHTMIAQLLIDNRGLFQSWLPYAELSTFTYHFGFHTLVACFYWISGLPIEKTILWVGQIVNLLAIICLYPLVKKLGRNLWSGVLLLLIAGLISPMPMFYLNWGRYTQLAGQAILPAAVFFIWLLLESDKLDHRVLVTSWIILGGLALTHYRILIFLIFFPIAFILLNLRAQPFKRLIPKTCLIGLGGAILFLPWLISIAPHNMLQGFITSLAASHSQATTSSTYYNVMESLLKYFPAGIWICFLVSIGWFLWRKKKNYITILLWWFLVIIAANPNLIGFPGTVGIDNFAVQIGYYIPIGIILSAAIASAVAALQIRLRQLDHLSPKLNTILLITSLVLLLIVIFYSSLSQVPQRIDDIAPTQYALATRPDQRAAGWIKKNTNLDDRFLVNSFFAFGGAWVVGSDGGWWLPLLTKRQSTQPPLNYANEEGFLPNNVARVNQIPRAILLKGLTDPSVMNLLRKRGVTYLCIGQQQGRVNSTQPLLDLAVIQGDPHFQLVYRQDQVWIYRIIY